MTDSCHRLQRPDSWGLRAMALARTQVPHVARCGLGVAWARARGHSLSGRDTGRPGTPGGHARPDRGQVAGAVPRRRSPPTDPASSRRGMTSHPPTAAGEIHPRPVSAYAFRRSCRLGFVDCAAQGSWAATPGILARGSGAATRVSQNGYLQGRVAANASQCHSRALCRLSQDRGPPQEAKSLSVHHD